MAKLTIDTIRIKLCYSFIRIEIDREEEHDKTKPNNEPKHIPWIQE